MAKKNDEWIDVQAIKRKSKFKLSLQKMTKNLDSPAGVFLDIISFLLVGSWLIIKYLGLAAWVLIKAVSIGFFIFIKSLADWSHSPDAQMLLNLGDAATGTNYGGNNPKPRKHKAKKVNTKNQSTDVIDILYQLAKQRDKS